MNGCRYCGVLFCEEVKKEFNGVVGGERRRKKVQFFMEHESYVEGETRKVIKGGGLEQRWKEKVSYSEGGSSEKNLNG